MRSALVRLSRIQSVTHIRSYFGHKHPSIMAQTEPRQTADEYLVGSFSEKGIAGLDLNMWSKYSLGEQVFHFTEA